MISVADPVVTDFMVRHIRKCPGNGCSRRGEASIRTTVTIVAIAENGERSFVNVPGACDQFFLAERQVQQEISRGSRAAA